MTQRPILSLALRFATLAIVTTCLGVRPAHCGELPKLAVFDTQLIDYVVNDAGDPTSTAEDAKRVTAASDVFRERMPELGVVQVLPKSADEGAKSPNLECPSCVIDSAKALGADFVMTSAAIHMSNIVVYLKAEVDDVATGRAVMVEDVTMKNFQNETQIRGAADYWMKLNGPSLKDALQQAAGGQAKAGK
jgi:uncharacterized protein DUF2380